MSPLFYQAIAASAVCGVQGHELALSSSTSLCLGCVGLSKANHKVLVLHATFPA